MRVVDAQDGALLDDARQLFRDYAESLPFDLGFQGFEQELATLPGAYALPLGCLLVALVDQEAVGCIGVRSFEGEVAELKRLWVGPNARGTGAGRALVAEAIRRAREAGFASLRLDTAPSMGAAQALYASFGFRPIEPYRVGPVPGTTFLELELR